jgi:FkbM family methyltransferase
MNHRFIELCNGFASNLRFSNRFQILYNRLFRRHLPLGQYIWQNRIFFICDNQRGDHRSVQECFCKRAYDPLLDQCQFPANRVSYVNIGANIGAFDLLLHERGLLIEAGLAVELNPFTCTRCQVNLQANQLSATQVVNAGIAGTAGFVMFHPGKLTIGDNIFFHAPADADGREDVRVQLLTLESLLEKHGRNRSYQLLKLDCEQAEYEIIRLSPVAVLAQFRFIIVEFHPAPAGESVQAAYEKLREAGFHPLRSQTQSIPYTDLFTNSNFNPR